MSNPSYWGETFGDEMRAKGILLSLEGPALELNRMGMTGRSIMLPSEYQALSLGGAELGQGYAYYGSQPPQQTSDWDKFMQFNAIVAPVLGNILGTWIQGRYQAQSAQTMAQAFDKMSPEQQTQVMQGYLVETTLRQQGQGGQMDNASYNNMGQMFGMANPNAVSNAYNNGFAGLQQAAGGNAQILAALNQSGAKVKGSAGFTVPSWVLLAAAAAAGYYFFIHKKSPGISGLGKSLRYV